MNINNADQIKIRNQNVVVEGRSGAERTELVECGACSGLGWVPVRSKGVLAKVFGNFDRDPCKVCGATGKLRV